MANERQGGSRPQSTRDAAAQQQPAQGGGADVAVRDAVGRQVIPAGVSTLDLRPDQTFFDSRQYAALQAMGVQQASVGELAVFMHQCRATGLDPFARQIYMIRRMQWDAALNQRVPKQTIQTGIDGYRVVRDRISQERGYRVEYEPTTWFDDDGKPTDVWVSGKPPAAARVVVVVDGRKFPGVVRYASYVQTNARGEPTAQWKSQPEHMLEKCAEAFALRRAFPQDLSGLYTDDEMGHLDNPDGPDAPRAGGPRRLSPNPPQPARPPVTAEVIPEPAAGPDWAASTGDMAASVASGRAAEAANARDGEGGEHAEPDGPDQPNLDESERGRLSARMMILFGKAGLADADRDARLGVTAMLAREFPDDEPVIVPSSKNLTDAQMGMVVAKLAAIVEPAEGTPRDMTEIRAGLTRLAGQASQPVTPSTAGASGTA